MSEWSIDPTGVVALPGVEDGRIGWQRVNVLTEARTMIAAEKCFTDDDETCNVHGGYWVVDENRCVYAAPEVFELMERLADALEAENAELVQARADLDDHYRDSDHRAAVFYRRWRDAVKDRP